ncbi:hypothetical protein [uncultured Methylobacterium sp.]|uniref:hypothetical protein n=1 Tax=uncultured Methylobacterium sp. TaxID=157278 RepID=UPI0035CAE122
MTPFPWQSRITKSPDIVFPIGSFIGIEEERTEIDKTELRRSLNGTGVPLGPLYDGILYRISLSASGPAVRWSPAFSHLSKKVPFRLASTKHLDFFIPAGGMVATLHRDPVDGRVLLFRADDRDEVKAPCTVVGRTVTLAAPTPFDLYGSFLPFHDVYLTDRGARAAEISGLSSWTMVAEEKAPY